jgi:hypothetical protein
MPVSERCDYSLAFGGGFVGEPDMGRRGGVAREQALRDFEAGEATPGTSDRAGIGHWRPTGTAGHA